jgi:hypothetical protein
MCLFFVEEESLQTDELLEHLDRKLENFAVVDKEDGEGEEHCD